MALTETQRYPSYLHTDDLIRSHWEDSKMPVKCSTPCGTNRGSMKLASDNPSRKSSGSLKQTLLNFSRSVREDDEATVAMTEDIDPHFAKSLNENLTKPGHNVIEPVSVKFDAVFSVVQDNSLVVSPVPKIVRSTKQSLLPSKPSKSSRLSRAQKESEKTAPKGSRYRSVDTRTTVTTVQLKPRTKAISLSPKKGTVVTVQAEVREESGRKDKRQTQLTTYGIRRTARQYVKAQELERAANTLNLLRDKVESGMKIIVTEEKGRGIVATRTFHDGEFVVEYAGELMSEKMAKEREAEYKRDPTIGSYMFYFVHNGQKYCVDATKETPRLGRLINHSRLHPNCQVKVIPLDGAPKLVLFAKQTIHPGEELLYDYGDRDKETMELHPWLKT
ncbi:hypothetical protein EG68_04897 [Paragonimus skrjabini miyazakii]|uniref:[histone H4]-lysine(20) N-methyltransferase n=1 Tax=Paragonimus skrjabini miyazakii TaxID=59628 RepID=A0A8S9YBX6_9TREM|nr:hypothetical protein EG68_04897 [Paragonimus skrjabini miyazakii]